MSYYQTSVPSLLPTPLPTPLPTALPSLTFQPSFLDCEAGFGVFDGGGSACAACPAGRYASDNGCEACAGGSVPSGGACFPGTWAASRVDNATGAPAHAPGVVDHEGSCYYFEAGGSTWTAAERSCNSLGGHLACVSGPSHARFVAEQAELRGVAAMWIGMSERGNEKAFSWTNPECCSDYRNWYETTDAEGTTTREPTEDIELISYRCVRMGATGELWDENCRAHFGYVCQAPVLSAATACAACRSGTYAASGASTCAACPFGKYARGEGHARCDACPTRSPASLLGTYFAPETTANAGGSVLCGGNLGRAQRSAYIVTSVFTAAGPLLLGTAAVFLQVNVGGFLVSRGLAGWPTRVHAYRSELIPMVFGSSLVASSLLGGALFAAWLQPLRQRSESWPYKGRLAATSLAKGCDPGERHASLVAGTVFLVVAAVCFLCCVPVVDVGAVAREVYRCVVRLRLRRDFLRQTRKWERERAATEAKVKNISSFACTLCRQRRAAALNLPCGHQFLCNECADRFREENGAICNACRAPSDVRDVILRTGASSRKRDDAQEVGPLGNIELAPVKASALERRTSRSASVAELRAAIAATKRARRGAQRRFLASACGVCGESKELVVDTPCGHATLCAACAAEFRGRSPVCSRCGEASEIVAPTLELCCSICFDSVSAQYLVALGACGHQLCTSCSVGYVRSCLGDVAELVRDDGLRCPLHVGGCDGVVTVDVVERLVTRPVRDDMAEETLPLRSDEFERLVRFFYEASIDVAERFYCTHPTCARLFAVPHRDALVKYGAGAGSSQRAVREGLAQLPRRLTSSMLGFARHLAQQRDNPHAPLPEGVDDELEGGAAPDDFEGPPPFVACPHCNRRSCVRCRVPAHALLTCEQVKDGPDPTATMAFVEATSKPCPQCAFRITHCHGHACHHIKPGTGCLNCGTHFCYACLQRGTSGSVCGCRLFCSNDGVEDHVALRPYPRDTRCGCTFCSDCRPGRPCSQCNGGCVVCRGVVPPGPASADEIDAWAPGRFRDGDDAALADVDLGA